MRTPDRRTVLVAAGLALGGAFAGDAATATDGSASTTPTQSAQLQYDAAKTGQTDASAPSTALGPAWRFQRPGADGCPSAPAVADDTLYFLSATRGDNTVHAVDADGTELWRTETAVTQCSPAVADGLVFVGGLGGLFALDAATGERRWHVDRGGLFEPSPTVADGAVYLPGAGDEGRIAARNTTDGTERWAFQAGTELPGSTASMTAVAVADGVAYAAVGTDAGVGELYALDAATGDQRWGAGFPRTGARYVGNVATPTVADGRVFFATDNALYALSLDGTQQWRVAIDGFTPGNYTEQSPAVADGTVYFPDGDGLSAFDAATGRRRWTFDAPAATVSSSPTVAGDVVYVGTEEAGVYALDAGSGDPVGQYRSSPDVRVVVPPVAVDGRVYVGEFAEADDADPTLVALESGDESVASAEPVPEFTVPDEVVQGTPVEFENRSDAFGDLTAVGDAAFRWDVDGDGETDVRTDAVTDPARYTFEGSGERTVTLTVENDYGWAASTSKSVTVSEHTDEGPVARIETEPPDAEARTFESGATVTLDASASTGGTSDLAAYEWTVNGHDDRSGVETSVELDGVCGDWHVTLTVTDEDGVTDETTVVLTVED